MLTRSSPLLLVCMLLVACNGTGVKRQVEALDESIKQYNIALRWLMYDKLDTYHVSRDGQRNRLDRDAVKNIRVTGYKVSEKTVNDDLTAATVKGEISYYSNEVGTLQKLPYEQSWWYDPQIKRWFMESNFPSFE